MLEAVVLQQTTDYSLNVEAQSLVVILQGFDLPFESSSMFSIDSLANGFQFVSQRSEICRGRLDRGRVLHKVSLGEISIQSFLAQEELVALIVFHQTGIGHSRLEEFSFQFMLSAASHVLHLNKLYLRFGQFKSQRFDHLIFL
jgi:hypothetical protein